MLNELPWRQKPFHAYLAIGFGLWIAGHLLAMTGGGLASLELETPALWEEVETTLFAATGEHMAKLEAVAGADWAIECGGTGVEGEDPYAGEACVAALNKCEYPQSLKSAMQKMQAIGLTRGRLRAEMTAYAGANKKAAWASIPGGTELAPWTNARDTVQKLSNITRFGEDADALDIPSLGALAAMVVSDRKSQAQATHAVGNALSARLWRQFDQFVELGGMVLLLIGLFLYFRHRATTDSSRWRFLWAAILGLLIAGVIDKNALDALGLGAAKDMMGGEKGLDALIAAPFVVLSQLLAVLGTTVEGMLDDGMWGRIGVVGAFVMLIRCKTALGGAVLGYLLLVITTSGVGFFPLDTSAMGASVGLAVLSYIATVLGAAGSLALVYVFWHVLADPCLNALMGKNPEVSQPASAPSAPPTASVPSAAPSYGGAEGAR